MSLSRLPAISIMFLILSACGQVTGHEVRPVLSHNYPVYESSADKPMDIALQQVGRPYRFGGSDPSGFDCSGLIYYAYRQSGISVPRASRDQLRYSRKISLSKMRPGDLVFFRIPGTKVSHVGIYTGDNRFVHAPSRGKQVDIANLDNPYWSRYFIRAGRINYQHD